MGRPACIRGVHVLEVSGDPGGTGINEYIGLKFWFWMYRRQTVSYPSVNSNREPGSQWTRMGKCACVPVRQGQWMFSTAGRIGIGKRPWRRGNSQFAQNRLVVRRQTGRCAEDDSVCGSAKGDLDANSGGVEEAAEELGIWCESGERRPSGAKARVDFAAFAARDPDPEGAPVPRSCPDTNPSIADAIWLARLLPPRPNPPADPLTRRFASRSLFPFPSVPTPASARQSSARAGSGASTRGGE
jgi:hypothetical protein